jgi:hypothetical protein
MAIRLNSPDWERTSAPSRGRVVTVPSSSDLPPEFLTPQSSVDETLVVRPSARVRGTGAVPSAIDFSCDLAPGESAVVAMRHPSGALTFHLPVETTRVTRGGQAAVRFVVPLQPSEQGPATRGPVGQLIKAMVIKVAKSAIDAVAGRAMRTLAAAVESAIWNRRNLQEGW